MEMFGLFKKDNSREIERLILMKTQALGRLVSRYIDGEMLYPTFEQRSEKIEKFFDEKIEKLK